MPVLTTTTTAAPVTAFVVTRWQENDQYCLAYAIQNIDEWVEYHACGDADDDDALIAACQAIRTAQTGLH